MGQSRLPSRSGPGSDSERWWTPTGSRPGAVPAVPAHWVGAARASSSSSSMAASSLRYRGAGSRVACFQHGAVAASTTGACSSPERDESAGTAPPTPPITPPIPAVGGDLEAAVGNPLPAVQSAPIPNAGSFWRRVHSFLHCLPRSPILVAALLSLEVSGPVPLVEGLQQPQSASLQWTLAQLLALHLRTGSTCAQSDRLLASLWLLQSLDSSSCSKASSRLQEYYRHLPAVSSQLSMALSNQWAAVEPGLRQRLVCAQMDLLMTLNWRLRLDFETEVRPCYDLLFQPQPLSHQQLALLGCPLDPAEAGMLPDGLRERWACGMRRLCAKIQVKALHLKSPRQALLCSLPPHWTAKAAVVQQHSQQTTQQQAWLPAAKRQRIMTSSV